MREKHPGFLCLKNIAVASGYDFYLKMPQHIIEIVASMFTLSFKGRIMLGIGLQYREA